MPSARRRFDFLSTGKCERCGQPLEPYEKRVCLPCKDRLRAHRQRIRRQRLNAGLCPDCGKNPPAPGIQLCQACRDRRLANGLRALACRKRK